MSAQNSVPLKKRRREPILIPVSLVDEGCRRIAENISELTDHARRFVDLSEEIVSRRVAEILVTHAMDEAGKLLEIIKKTIEAGHTGETSISIEDFYSHPRKGAQAGNIGILAIDWLESTIEGLGDPGPEELRLLASYRIHLEELKKDFSRHRESVLYVDFDESGWVSPTAQDEDLISTDALLLGMLAELTLDTLKHGLPIQDLDKIVRQIADLSTFREFQMRLKDRVESGKPHKG